MTQTYETTHATTMPARRRPAGPLPVLISVPDLAPPRQVTRVTSRPRARRRLRREVRVAGYLLLALLPASMAFFVLGGERLPTLAVGLTAQAREPADEAAPRRAAMISIEPLEPVISVRRSMDAPVILPGYLLPADAVEESSDGGH